MITNDKLVENDGQVDYVVQKRNFKKQLWKFHRKMQSLRVVIVVLVIEERILERDEGMEDVLEEELWNEALEF